MTTVVVVVVFPLVGFFQKRTESSRVTLFFYFIGKYVRTEWLTVSNLSIDCFQIHVICSIGYIANSQWPALQLA